MLRFLSHADVLSLSLSLSRSRLAVVDKDLSSAKALYEEMQKEGIAADELSLKRLAVLFRNEGEMVPFTEPPVSLTHCQCDWIQHLRMFDRIYLNVQFGEEM